VTGAGGGISCGATCSASFADATTVTLTPAAASGSTFTGWSGACSGTGPCIVSMLGDRTVTATFAAVSSGGGGGGGGGTSVPNLGTSIVVKTNPIAPGEVDELTIFVKNAGGAGSLQTDLKIQLPASLTLLGPPYYERGSGCTGTTSIDCFLDYLPNGETTKVIFDVRATATGPQTVTAVVTSDRDSDATDNTATLILQVGSPLPPPVSPPPPPLPSPVLAQLPNRVLQAVRKGGTESVVARFSTNESLHLGMTVTRDGSTRLLRLLKGTRLAAATAPSARLTLTGTAARAGAYSLHVLLARSGLVKGKTYVIRIAARNRDGKRATLKIRFRA
jgi:hypothetical protein